MAESVLVGVAAGAIKPLLSKLSELLQEKRAEHKSLEHDIRFLIQEMDTISATLEELANSEKLNDGMTIWRDNIRELSYDMEDCVDDFVSQGAYEIREYDGPTRDLIQKIRDKFTGIIPNVHEKWKKRKPRNKAASEIKQLKKRLIEESQRHERYANTLPTQVPSTSGSAKDHLPLVKALYPAELMGINDPKGHIIEHLKMFQVVSIVGAGGLGKTTLANQVYSEIKEHFSCAAFVSVSQKPNMEVVLRNLARSMEINHTTNDDDVPQLIEILRDYLKNKRYLMVIDDLWDVESWVIIGSALIENDCGSRIITTTRKKEVAPSASKGGYVYEMRPLNSTDSKMLFFERVFGAQKQDYPHLQKVSSEILRKCDGLPLAIITIAGMLYQKDLDEWNRVLGLFGSALSKQDGADKMTNILSLSYIDLPHDLRTCLLYFSLFPEDHTIGKEHLIYRWIAEGFIAINEQSDPLINGGRSAYEVGEGYFSDLVNRNLIQAVDTYNVGQADSGRVHDIVLDFITCKAAEENFATSFNVEENRGDPRHRVRRLSIHNRIFDTSAALPKSLKFSRLRSLTLFGSFMRIDLSAFPYLRVLDLRAGGQFVNIGKCVYLKYLAFSEEVITELPEGIEKLQHLETLDIGSTQIRELQPTITRLQRLARLRVRQHAVFPAGTIGKMKSLEELDCFSISSGEQSESLKEFSQLTKLRKLVVCCRADWSNNLDERSIQAGNFQSHLGTLISACNLHHLSIYNNSLGQDRDLILSMESWCPADGNPSSLQNLSFTYCYIDKVPNWMSSSANLREIELYVFSIGRGDFVVLGAIPTLLRLTLNTYNGHKLKGQVLIRGEHGFRILKYFCLTIMECGTSVWFESGSMPKLEYLELDVSGHKMECLNGGSDFGVHHLSALTKVEIRVCGVGNYPDGVLPGHTVERLVQAAIKKLPKRPTLKYLDGYRRYCVLNGRMQDMKYSGEKIRRELPIRAAREIEREAPGTSSLRVLVCSFFPKLWPLGAEGAK